LGGGADNLIHGAADAVLVGGQYNTETGGLTGVGSAKGLMFLGGGAWNTITGNLGVICGGGGDVAFYNQGSTASGDYSFIGGGFRHVASGNFSTIAGGTANHAAGINSFV